MRRGMKNVALVQPQCSFELQGDSVLNTQFDSLGLLSLAAFLRVHGYGAPIFHFARALALGASRESLLDQVIAAEPIVVGISINWLHLSRGAIEVAREVKRRLPSVPVVVGGQHATFFADDILRGYHGVIDGVAMGEGEETLLEVVERTARREPLHGTPGLLTWDGEPRLVRREVTLPLPSLPLLSYEEIYPQPAPGDPIRRIAALDTSRGGCRKDCTYCLESCTLGGLGRRSPIHHGVDRLVEQIEHYASQGRDWITIQDQFFTHGDAPMLKLIEGLARSEVRLQHLSLFLEPGSYSREVYDRLVELPVDEVVLSYGVETGSPKVARNLRRFYDYDAILAELEYVAEKRYLSSTWWMVGLPEESAEDIRLTQRMIGDTMDIGVYARWVTPLILFPQTELAQQRDRFKIRQILRTFEDFSRFSTTQRNEYAIYPELITHESEFQSAQETLRYLAEIKETVESHIPAAQEANRNKTDISGFAQFRKWAFF